MTSQRNHFIDGLRGLAALSVVNFHFFAAFYPNFLPEYSRNPYRVADTPLAVLYNGNFAVSIFFTLSGFVLANSAAKRHMPLAINLIQRYFRLAVPVFVSTLVAYALLRAFRGTPSALREVVPSDWLKYAFDRDLPGFATAVRSGIFDLWSGGSMFNNVLWTMKIELIGSILIYATYAMQRIRWILACLIAILILSSVFLRFEYGCFACGALLREAVTTGRLPKVSPWLALCAGIVIGAAMPGYDMRVLAGLLHAEKLSAIPAPLRLGAANQAFALIASCLILYAVLSSPKLASLLSLRPFRFLGEISFGFYLVHVPLIYSIIGRIFLQYRPSTAGNLLCFYGFFLTITLASGFLFTIAVDRPVIRTIHFGQSRWRSWRNDGERDSRIGESGLRPKPRHDH